LYENDSDLYTKVRTKQSLILILSFHYFRIDHQITTNNY